MRHRPTKSTTAVIAILLHLIGAAALADAKPETLDPAQLEAAGAVIGDIVLLKQDVFDLSDPRENNALYELANKLHIITRDEIIEKQLLFAPGDTFSKRLVEESERILRANKFFYDVSITPANYRDGVVDLYVRTRDVWTLRPGFSFSRKGGENRTLVKLEELNLFGRGQQLLLSRSSDVDRDSTTFEFRDHHMGRSWTSVVLRIADNSDGHSNLLSVVRPFHALDARWSAGMTAFDDDRVSTLYRLGEEAAEYRHERRLFSAFGGWSAGLRDGWVHRYTIGAVFDENIFSDVVEGTLPPAVPEDRELVYPFFGIEILQDRFETATNRDQIMRTEDFLTGTHLSASLGWADEGLGADRDALIYRASGSRTFGDLATEAMLVKATTSGRVESGDTVNALFGADIRYYRQQSEKRTFFATLSGTHGHDLDLDNPVQLGGDTGLRGYPLRYQTGHSKLLLTVEQRYFWDWYPFRLFRVGGAIFADVGRTWGSNPVGGGSLGWLRDVGIGLRFAPTRTASRNIIHFDIAFPLDGDDSIDSVQFLLESKKRF